YFASHYFLLSREHSRTPGWPLPHNQSADATLHTGIRKCHCPISRPLLRWRKVRDPSPAAGRYLSARTMPFDFLHQHRARRLRQYLEQPPLELPETDAAAQADEPEVCLDLEYDAEDWRPIPISGPIDPDVLPRRFIDGCHRGETVAWLQAPQGYPIPVRLAEIGGVCMQLDGRTLRREFAVVERVVSLIVDPFPWNE